MRYTVILVPAEPAVVSASVPAMPGCVSSGRDRDQALLHVQEAVKGWMEAEAEEGRGPLAETPGLVTAAVAEALDILEEMRAAGEIPSESGYQLEITSVEIGQLVPA